MADSAKKQRVDEAVGELQSIVADETHSKLPPELWSGVLGYLFFDDVLRVIAVNRFFNRDVPRRVKRLLIRTSGSMDVSTSAVEKFSGVAEVFVYSLVEEIDEDTRRFDAATTKRALRFVSRLPKLERCFVGGLCTCEDEEHAQWTADDVQCDLTYRPGDEHYATAESDAKYAEFVESICRAYASGEISQNLNFDRVVPEQWGVGVGKPCCWAPLPEISSHRNDVDCQMCDLLCASFPPLQVMDFSNKEIPCISPENRLKIAMCRDPNMVKANLMETLLHVMKRAGAIPVFHSPNITEECCATNYGEEQFAKMRWLVSNGADVKDSRIRKMLLRTAETWDENTPFAFSMHHQKRIMALDVYNELKDIGFDFHKNDFVLVDYSDIRSRLGRDCD